VREELHTDWEVSHKELLVDPDREEHPVGLDKVAPLADSGTQVAQVDKVEHPEGSPEEVAYNLDHLDSG